MGRPDARIVLRDGDRSEAWIDEGGLDLRWQADDPSLTRTLALVCPIVDTPADPDPAWTAAQAAIERLGLVLVQGQQRIGAEASAGSGQ